MVKISFAPLSKVGFTQQLISQTSQLGNKIMYKSDVPTVIEIGTDACKVQVEGNQLRP
jgi:hypothetical protein